MSSDAIARLRALATRLAAAPEYTDERARSSMRHVARWMPITGCIDPSMERSGRLAYQAGALEQICRSSADELASIIRQLETP